MRDPPMTTLSPSHQKTRDRKDSSRLDASDKTGSYRSPPWTFTGKALYQLSLVRIEDARKYVPDTIPLVNIFGYTLGGFYLARYSGSPAGQFDELVALAGLAWNFPTSCAWAARVYVNNDEAKQHGLNVVGLPSRRASFTRTIGGSAAGRATASKSPKSPKSSEASDWWGVLEPHETSTLRIHNADARRATIPVCSIDMSSTQVMKEKGRASRAPPRIPKIQMFLPSFSGATALCPDILKYSLRLATSVRFLKPMPVVVTTAGNDTGRKKEGDGGDIEAFIGQHVLGGRPLVCMSFDSMTMEVEAPERFTPRVSEYPSTSS